MDLKKTWLIATFFLSSLAFAQDVTKGLKFEAIGPERGGRSTAVCGVHKDVNTYYMGSTGGGVWKTINQGASWQNISDGFFGGSIGSVAVAPSDDNVIYVGQGEESFRGNVSSGFGIWKSEDAGETWSFCGLKETRHITFIAVHPENPDIVYASAMGNLFKDSENRGLYKSINGGKTWKKVLFISNSAGCNEVSFDPHNARILYATTWRVRRTPYSFSSGGEGSGVWKSTDSGETWKELTTNKGLPQGVLGKMTIAPSAAKRNLLFLMVEHKTKGGLYKSEDGGKTWTVQNQEAKIRQRAWYFSRVYAHPKSANTVYIMNVRFQKSEDGGRTFKAVRTPHVDHHGLWINPVQPEFMIVANDGGGQVSTNGGASWSTYYNQQTMQFYRVSTDNNIPYRIYGAQQDNSTVRINSVTRSWEVTAGGESAHIAPDPNNSEIVYAGNYDGYLTRYNHDTRESRAINVWPDNPMGHGAEEMKYRFNWNFPLFFSVHDSSRLYAFSNHVHISNDGGSSWQILSPDLTRNEEAKLKSSGGPITQDNTGVEYYCTLFAGEESPTEEGVLYVGSDDGLLHITRDDGQTWTDITPSFLPKYVQINSIDASKVPGTCFVAATAYKSGDDKPYVLVTRDYGKSWKMITDGIEAGHFARVVRQDLINPDVLYCGTEHGFYISKNAGNSWEKFKSNLPIVPITDIALKNDALILATQGRSMWRLNNLEPFRNPQKLFVGQSSLHLVSGQQYDVHVFIEDSTKRYTLDFTSQEGKLLRTFSNQKGEDTLEMKLNKGWNSIAWNLREKGIDKPDDMILWWSRLTGPKVPPGKYAWTFKRDGQIIEKQDFTLLADPNSEASNEDYQAQYIFLNEVVDKVNEIHVALKEMKEISSQIKNLQKRQDMSNYPIIEALADSILVGLDSLQNDLYQTKNKSEQDPINYPIKLNNKLAHLNSLVGMGNYAPTKQAEQVKAELVKEVDDRLTFYQKDMMLLIERLNLLIRESDMPIIVRP
jgi:photosystem II stability/assembly factor-like uncharacterized protein